MQTHKELHHKNSKTSLGGSYAVSIAEIMSTEWDENI